MKQDKQVWNELCRTLEAILEVQTSVKNFIQGSYMILCEIAVPLLWKMNQIGSERITKVATEIIEIRGDRVQTGMVAVETEQKLLECWDTSMFIQLLAKWRKAFQRKVMSDQCYLQFLHCVLVITTYPAKCMACGKCLIHVRSRKDRRK